MTPLRETTVMAAIRTIADETGSPPDVRELALALGATEKQVHSALRGAKQRGAVRYDEAERLVLS